MWTAFSWRVKINIKDNTGKELSQNLLERAINENKGNCRKTIQKLKI
jgi:hypothetical protein